MKKTMRDSDTVCRFGGEEFLVICPGANVEDAKLVGNRIRKAVQDNIITTKEFQGSVTISIGVGVKNSGHESAKDMIKDADEALYAAKEAGRNKVCIASPD
jgi:diguanylate cyclase (GGDEF)-like protein